LLSASPLVATGVETQLFSIYARSLFDAWRDGQNQRRVGLRNLFDEDEYFNLVRDFSSRSLARLLASKPGATVLLEKTPDHALYWRDILRLFPDASFIHLIRDPRGVVASMQAARQTWAAWKSPMISKSCAHWIENVTAAREIRNATSNYLEIRYRDLKQDGINTLRSVFAWCGINIPETEVEEILRRHDIDHLRSPDAPGLAVEYGSWGKEFFRKGEMDGWQCDLTRRQIALVEHLTQDLMNELGYLPVTARKGWRSMIVSPAVLCGRICAALAWRLQRVIDHLSRWA
jgi:hypothetical protein